jgi:hypothetical protein
MVAAIHFFATEADEQSLFEYLCRDSAIYLFPWAKMVIDAPTFLDPSTLPKLTDTVRYFGILNARLGQLRFVNHKPQKLSRGGAKSFVFNVMAWEAMKPQTGEGIIDWDATPALFWQRCTRNRQGSLGNGNLGSQAEAMQDVSQEYRRWVNRVMAWIRRNGVKVMDQGRLTPPARRFKIRSNGSLNARYALPDAMAFFRAGGAGRT